MNNYFIICHSFLNNFKVSYIAFNELAFTLYSSIEIRIMPVFSMNLFRHGIKNCNLPSTNAI